MEVLSRILRKTEESDLIRDFQEGAVNSVGVRIPICCLQMTLFYSVMLKGTASFHKVGFVLFSSFYGVEGQWWEK